MTAPPTGSVGPQRLYQQAAAQVVPDGGSLNTGSVTLTFPPVPQGSVWTGTIQVTSDEDPGQVLAGANFTLTRNGQPYLSWTGYGQAVNVQGTGQDVFQIQGFDIGPVDEGILCTAQWIGRSDDQASAPLLWPYVTASPAIVQVSSFSPDGLLVIDNGIGGGSPSVVSVLGAGANSNIVLVTPASNTQLRLWEISLSGYCGGAASGQFQIHIQDTSGGSTDYCTCMVFNAANAEGNNSAGISLHGLTLPAGVGIKLVTSNSAASITAAACNVFFDVAI